MLQCVTECYIQSIKEYKRVLQKITEYYRVFLAHLLGPIFGLVIPDFPTHIVTPKILFLTLGHFSNEILKKSHKRDILLFLTPGEGSGVPKR